MAGQHDSSQAVAFLDLQQRLTKGVQLQLADAPAYERLRSCDTRT